MWPNPLETAELVTFTEEILKGKVNSLRSVMSVIFFLTPENIKKPLEPLELYKRNCWSKISQYELLYKFPDTFAIQDFARLWQCN